MNPLPVGSLPDGRLLLSTMGRDVCQRRGNAEGLVKGCLDGHRLDPRQPHHQHVVDDGAVENSCRGSAPHEGMTDHSRYWLDVKIELELGKRKVSGKEKGQLFEIITPPWGSRRE